MNAEDRLSEKDEAIHIANKALDVPNADPDDDLRTISRQFLRSIEQLKQERNKAIDECMAIVFWHFKNDDEPYKPLKQKIESLKLKSE